MQLHEAIRSWCILVEDLLQIHHKAVLALNTRTGGNNNLEINEWVHARNLVTRLEKWQLSFFRDWSDEINSLSQFLRQWLLCAVDCDEINEHYYFGADLILRLINGAELMLVLQDRLKRLQKYIDLRLQLER